MTNDPTERPTPAVRTAKAYKKGKKRGRKLAGVMMAFGGGAVGMLWGIGSGMKEVIVELLPDDEEEVERAVELDPMTGLPRFLQPQST